MSNRELIIADIVLKLKEINSVKMGAVTREPMFRDQTEFYGLARTNFPHVIVTAGNESREDLTMGGSSIIREGLMTVEIISFVKASDKTIDGTINALIEAIEEKLDADRTRNGKAKDTQVKQITMGDNLEHPYGTFTMNVEVQYIFTRGVT
tara:strand:- start:1265 stop:1717 length:453 start_codon:yes stop_codon:yes gene_type:complete